VLFEARLRRGLADGSITVTFRRWKRPQVVAGGRYRTGEGLVEVTAVDIVDDAAITRRDARAAGYDTVDELLRNVPARDGEDVSLYRVTLHAVDDADPRDELAAANALSPDDIDEITRRLDRLDRASSHGEWTRAVLERIASEPGRRAPDLAVEFGREVLLFKRDVRKLKELGLTISLTVGYKLSPRGEAYLRTASKLRSSPTRGVGNARKNEEGQVKPAASSTERAARNTAAP
jgi:hypothetical protein